MKKHPQESVDAVLKEQASRRSSSVKQRLASASTAMATKLPEGVWSIKIPKVFSGGSVELEWGEFIHLLFVSGTKEQVRKIAKAITGLGEMEGEEAQERPNWKIERGRGEEVVVEASKFLAQE